MRGAEWALGIGILLVSSWAWPNSKCERPISVAASPLGEALKIKDQQVSGIIPDLLSKVTQETGCQFKYEIVPRARAFSMFERGEIDIIPAAQTEERDQIGFLIAFISVKNALITRKSRSSKVAPLLLLQQGKLLVNVVRGINTGAMKPSAEYIDLITQLRQQNKLEEVVDLDLIARKMSMNRADATISPPMNFLGAATLYGIADDLQVTLLDDIAVSRAGLYLSKKLFTDSDTSNVDAQRVKSILHKVISEGYVWRMYQERLPAWSLIGVTPIFEK